MREFFAKLEQSGLPMNMAQTIGHTQVRSLVVGQTDRKADPAGMERTKAMVPVYAPEEEIADLLP